MQPRNIPIAPIRKAETLDDLEMASPPSFPSRSTTSSSSSRNALTTSAPSFSAISTSPARFTTNINAFGLQGSPSSSSSSRDEFIPPVVVPGQKRLRRPSMLILAQNASMTDIKEDEQLSVIQDPSSSQHAQRQDLSNPFSDNLHTAKWPPFLHRTSSGAPPIETLTTTTAPDNDPSPRSGTDSPMNMDFDNTSETRSPLRWAPSHLQTGSSRRKGKAKAEEPLPDTPLPQAPPFTGRPIPGPLLATLISESSPLEHEMRSEARLQRLLASNPQTLPFTPRPSRSSRGRFPEMAEDGDDDFHPWRRQSWMGRGRASSSDSDSDEMEDLEVEQGEPVNSAFAAGMDMDRPGSSHSTGIGAAHGTSRSNSGGLVTPGTGSGWGKGRMSFSGGLGMVPSPGSGLGLPGAFGGLGMGGMGTPMGSPTIERLELVGSPGAAISSPGLLQYRDSNSMRPGKRKAQEDRYDPYKRPRGVSPSASLSLSIASANPLSPSRQTPSIPVPASPSHLPIYPSSLSTSASNRRSAYTRPIAGRSRAASPALSIGSTSGILSESLGSMTGAGRASISLGQAFIPTGMNLGGGAVGVHGQALGGLGLMSLSGERRADEMSRDGSRESREGMEED